jgi:hypothetical protein
MTNLQQNPNKCLVIEAKRPECLTGPLIQLVMSAFNLVIQLENDASKRTELFAILKIMREIKAIADRGPNPAEIAYIESKLGDIQQKYQEYRVVA